ncbi:Fc.00g079540.m01.CDS01 [Cosmosporella sp. VM-42]
MYSKVLIATTLLAATASAQANFMLHAEMKREILQPRQTDGSISTECQTALLEVYSSVPTPPVAIISDLAEHPQTDPCHFSTPASLSKEYASYSSEVVSWYSANQDEISSALSECPILSQYATAVPVCATGAGGDNSKPATGVASKTSESGSKATDSGDSSSGSAGSGSKTSGSGSSPSGTESAAATQTTNAGHRETGMALAAIAVFGAVLAL